MKRLLAYLFIILGLGLTFSVNSWAPVKMITTLCKKDSYSFNDLTRPVFFVKENYCYINSSKISIEEYVDILLNWNLKQKANIFWSKDLTTKLLKSIRNEFIENELSTKYLDDQLVKKFESVTGVFSYGVNGKIETSKWHGSQKPLSKETILLLNDTNQNQKVKNKTSVFFCKYETLLSIKKKDCSKWSTKLSEQEFITNFLFRDPKSNNVNNSTLSNNLSALMLMYIVNKLDKAIIINTIKNDNSLKNYLPIINFNETQIAKVEPTIKSKKKIKVAKVEDSTQEEFKPKKTNRDNDPPVIDIAEAITVNDSIYEIEGKVIDKSKKLFLQIDGETILVNNGKFKVKRYSPVDEQIKIVAIDQWGNKSKTKLVNITIDIDETIVANKLEPLNPSNISNKSSNNKVALIIGIENYTEAPKANYANLDAKYFFDYARRAFGVNKQNINLLLNEEATVVKTDKAVSLWLKSKIKKNKSDLIIFFAGHGLASSDGKELYLLPQDGNPDRLERTALSRTDLFKEIISLNPKSVTMFLDTCYSGVSRDEQMLLASARPIRIVADEQETPNNFTIFSASQLDQISSGLKEANHGIFSYYLMKGMEGNADSNKDKNITNGELLAYMDENISQKAAEQGREQNPSLAGNPDKILMSYR